MNIAKFVVEKIERRRLFMRAEQGSSFGVLPRAGGLHLHRGQDLVCKTLKAEGKEPATCWPQARHVESSCALRLRDHLEQLRRRF